MCYMAILNIFFVLIIYHLLFCNGYSSTLLLKLSVVDAEVLCCDNLIFYSFLSCVQFNKLNHNILHKHRGISN